MNHSIINNHGQPSTPILRFTCAHSSSSRALARFPSKARDHFVICYLQLAQCSVYLDRRLSKNYRSFMDVSILARLLVSVTGL